MIAKYLIVVVIFLFAGCSNAQNKTQMKPTESDTITKKNKVLIVYLTRTNNTKAVRL